MMNMFFSTINSKIGGSTPPPTPSYDFDIFIDAGQSNIDGRVPFIDRPEWILSNGIVPGVKMFNGTQFNDWQFGVNTGAAVSTTTDWAFDSVFHYNISQALNITPFVIKRSQGGTAIEVNESSKGCWNIDFAALDALVDTPALLRELRDRIDLATAYLDSINKTYKFRGFIWHQGESDADLGTTAQNNYYQNFKDVIAFIRNHINEPELPCIFGMIPDASASYNLTIRNAQIQISNEDNNAYLVDLSDLTLLDAYHFDAASSELAGNRYSDTFMNNNL